MKVVAMSEAENQVLTENLAGGEGARQNAAGSENNDALCGFRKSFD